MVPLLKILSDHGEMKFADSVTLVGGLLGLTEEDMAERYPSGKANVLYARVNWASVYLGKAGLVHRPSRGMVAITPEGEHLLQQNPRSLDKESLMVYPSFAAWFEVRTEESADQVELTKNVELLPEEQIEVASKELEKILQSDLLEVILNNSPAFFERLIVDLLIAMGYGSGKSEMGQTLGQTGDGGVDGVINEDRLGLDVIYIQAKRYAPENKITPDQIRAFVGSLSEKKAHKGVFVTTSSYTKSALESAKNSRERIILIDGDELTKLLIRYSVGVRTRATYEIKRIDDDYFEER